MDLREQLVRDEGFRSKPYLDCCGKYWRDCACEVKGKLTIGVGRNLDDVELTFEESAVMLDNDMRRARAALLGSLPWAAELDEVRREVLVTMAFNMGIGSAAKGTGLLGFPKMLAACKRGDYVEAAREMLDSRWKRQVGDRANRLATQMQTGVRQ